MWKLQAAKPISDTQVWSKDPRQQILHLNSLAKRKWAPSNFTIIWVGQSPTLLKSENTIGLENNLWVKIKLSPNKRGMQKANSENIKWMFSQLVYMPTAPLFNKQCHRDITVDCVLPKDRAQVARSTGKPWRDISGDPGTNNRAQAQAALHFWSQGFYKHVRPGSIAFSMRILSTSPLQTPRVLSWALFSL